MSITAYKTQLDHFLSEALAEDIGTGDITTATTIPQSAVAYGRYLAKEDGVLCGMDVVRRVFELLDERIVLTVKIPDGARVHRGDVIAEVRGPAGCVLSGERVGLNLLQHLSGIATRTAQAVESVAGYRAVIADTRKTTPGLRVLEKYAVRTGGGSNHRFNLADGILIKDNHIVAAGSITRAVQAARKNAPHTLKIEVEVESLAQMEEAIAAGADIVMLDNMDCAAMTEAVAAAAGRVKLEASGNMGDRDLAKVAATGVDIISIGALTHSVRALDISLKFKLENA